jgi:hypothetical protein
MRGSYLTLNSVSLARKWTIFAFFALFIVAAIVRAACARAWPGAEAGNPLPAAG